MLRLSSCVPEKKNENKNRKFSLELLQFLSGRDRVNSSFSRKAASPVRV